MILFLQYMCCVFALHLSALTKLLTIFTDAVLENALRCLPFFKYSVILIPMCCHRHWYKKGTKRTHYQDKT